MSGRTRAGRGRGLAFAAGLGLAAWLAGALIVGASPPGSRAVPRLGAGRAAVERAVSDAPLPRPALSVGAVVQAAPPASAPSAAPERPDLPFRSVAQPEDAIPLVIEPSAAAVEERDERVAALRHTGPGGDAWSAHFRDVAGEWQRIAARENIALKLGGWECNAGGCSITTEFEALEDLENFSRRAVLGVSSKSWRGASFRSGPLEADGGHVAATWIFYAPPEGKDSGKRLL